MAEGARDDPVDRVPGGPRERAPDGAREAVLQAIDDANAQDPVRIQYQGSLVAKEPLHARLMTDWLGRLDPAADDLQHIAARAHHLRRWTRPRGDHPEGRAGYLRWRAEAKRFHAREVGELMAAHGYPAEDVDRVARIITKAGLGTDPAVQTHEDCLCLVFLETQLADTTARLGAEEMVRILARTLPKMSRRGIDAAAGLDLGPDGAALLARAVERAAEDARASSAKHRNAG